MRILIYGSTLLTARASDLLLAVGEYELVGHIPNRGVPTVPGRMPVPEALPDGGRRPNGLGYDDFDVSTVGFAYHLTDLAAAVGLESLAVFPDSLARRRLLAARYREGLAGVPGVALLAERPDRQASPHFFTILVERRAAFVRRLREARIEVSVVHWRNDSYSVFGGPREDLPGLASFSERYIALPTHAGMTIEDADRIVATIRAGW
jgi:dTDP-4-amino-4,6-dideoxygalactose transaminase